MSDKSRKRISEIVSEATPAAYEKMCRLSLGLSKDDELPEKFRWEHQRHITKYHWRLTMLHGIVQALDVQRERCAELVEDVLQDWWIQSGSQPDPYMLGLPDYLRKQGDLRRDVEIPPEEELPL